MKLGKFTFHFYTHLYLWTIGIDRVNEAGYRDLCVSFGPIDIVYHYQ
jgi:hypothetical protein